MTVMLSVTVVIDEKHPTIIFYNCSISNKYMSTDHRQLLPSIKGYFLQCTKHTKYVYLMTRDLFPHIYK